MHTGRADAEPPKRSSVPRAGRTHDLGMHNFGSQRDAKQSMDLVSQSCLLFYGVIGMGYASLRWLRDKKEAPY